MFKNAELQAKFDRDGYVVIDFLTPEETKTVADKYYELQGDNLPKGFSSPATNPDENIKRNIFQHIEKSLQKAVSEHFQDYKVLGGTFLCKAPGDEGKVGVHQDWMVVDEKKYYTITIWIPTLDVDESNGALRVIPGSHLFFDYYRSNNIPVWYRGNETLLWDSMITEPMKAGQAFILNHAVIHGSSPNKTPKERLVITYALAPKEANLFFYHKERNEKGDKIEKFEMPDDFFQRYFNLGERPLFGNMVEKFDYSVPALSRDQILQLLENEKRKRGDVIPKAEHSSNGENFSFSNFIRKLKERIF